VTGRRAGSRVEAEIIAIGSELLLGRAADTNSLFLADELLKLGIEVRYKTVIGDAPQDIEEALLHALSRVRLVIATGGLGPTQDDMTRKAVARVTGRQLVLHEAALAAISERLAVRGRLLTPQQTTQALIPRRATIIGNPVGIAPGFFLIKDDRGLMCLPGVPSEMKLMFLEGAKPCLESLAGGEIHGSLLRRRLRTFGLTESEVDRRLRDLYDSEPTAVLGLQAGEEGVDVSITVKARHAESAQSAIKRIERGVRERLGHSLYAAGSQTMEGILAMQLKARRLTVSVAESCTGGLVSQRLTSIPGSSNYFNCGYIVYSNRAKVEMLRIPRVLLKEKGAVSQAVAAAMAEAARAGGATDLGLAVTGIAGPGGGTKDKPVGLVFWALADKKQSLCRSAIFGGDREAIRHRASQAVLDMLRRHLAGKVIE
jgi:nicotinamide-nucleotide amidase